jgi:transcriptional regulator of arginine metabolism
MQMSGTAARHRALRSILARNTVTSQADLVSLLKGSGYDVTQATVSRDLHAVGAVKARDGDGVSHYVLADDLLPSNEAEEALAHAMDEYAESIQVSLNLVIIKTPPGAAHVVAAAVDSSSVVGVLGTVAGDDTLMIIASEDVGGQRVRSQLERIGAA